MPQCNGNGNDHSERLGAGLGVLTRAPAEAVKALADALLPELGNVQVLRNRTGLSMLPMRDPVQGATFYLGEILVAEAHVEVAGAVEGYAACLGRDLEQALAVALVDAAWAAGVGRERIAAYLEGEAVRQGAEDRDLLRLVESTRVEMETFEWQP